MVVVFKVGCAVGTGIEGCQHKSLYSFTGIGTEGCQHKSLFRFTGTATSTSLCARARPSMASHAPVNLKRDLCFLSTCGGNYPNVGREMIVETGYQQILEEWPYSNPLYLVWTPVAAASGRDRPPRLRCGRPQRGLLQVNLCQMSLNQCHSDLRENFQRHLLTTQKSTPDGGRAV